MTDLQQLYYLIGRLERLKNRSAIQVSEINFLEEALKTNSYFNISLNSNFDSLRDSDDMEDDYDDYNDYDNYSEKESYGQYSGSYAQDVEGLSDDFINDVLDGEPDAYWNID